MSNRVMAIVAGAILAFAVVWLLMGFPAYPPPAPVATPPAATPETPAPAPTPAPSP